MADDRHDDDPTGMRRLLSHMADAHPVPDDLASRIAARLEAERRDRDHGSHCHFDSAVASPRRRRTGIAVSAGVLSVAAVLATAVFVFHIDDEVVSAQASRALARLQAESTPTQEGIADGTGERSALGASDEDSDEFEGPPTTAEVRVLTSGIEYRRGRLTEQVRELLSRRPVAGETAHTPIEQTGRVPSRAEVLRCLEALSLDRHESLVDVATFDGTPAMVLVSDHAADPAAAEEGDTASSTVTVVPESCGSGNPTTPLAGPYSLH